jgi:hypothetical protein
MHAQYTGARASQARCLGKELEGRRVTTPLALAQARHQQAVIDLQAAEAELLACMQSIEPTFRGTVAAMWDRRWESRLEGVKLFWELAQAHSAWRRATRREAKAKSAAYRASFTPAPPVTPVKRARKKLPRKMTFAAYIEARAA